MSAGASFSSCLPDIVLPFCTPQWVLVIPYSGYWLYPTVGINRTLRWVSIEPYTCWECPCKTRSIGVMRAMIIIYWWWWYIMDRDTTWIVPPRGVPVIISSLWGRIAYSLWAAMRAWIAAISSEIGIPLRSLIIEIVARGIMIRASGLESILNAGLICGNSALSQG